jgi:phosphocarrier protein HPr
VISRELVIVNKLGLHARAAAKLAATAKKFSSEIQIDKSGHQVNAKSIMGLMMLAAGKGCHLSLLIEGADELAAANAVEALVADRFDEQE